MKQLRWRFGALVIWLVLIFNIERLNLYNGTTETSINVASFVYVLVALTAVATLLATRWRQIALLAGLAFVIYVGIKLIHTNPIFGGIHTYITITEVLALLGTVALTGLVGRSMRDFERAVEAISMPASNERLLVAKKAPSRISIEMRRARRHGRPISAISISVDPKTFEATLHQAVKEVQTAMVEQYAKVRLGQFLAQRVRETDMVVQQNQPGRFLVLAPETTAENSRAFMNRLERESFDQLGLRFHYGIADFPGAALTSEDLMLRSEEALRTTMQQSEDTPASVPAAQG